MAENGVQLNLIKPILKRNCLHKSNNIIICWKSFEVWLVRLDYQEVKEKTPSGEIRITEIPNQHILNPIYAPLNEAVSLLNLPTEEIEN